jgi:hypothetical protein
MIRRQLAISPEDPEQIMRLQAFRADHPDVIIGPISRRAWQACIPEPDDRQTVITRRELKDLLDLVEPLVTREN